MMVGLGFGLIGMLMMVLFWGGLILLAIWIVRALFAGGHKSTNTISNPGLNARQILDQRYARGEITQEQYELMKKDIE